MATPTVDELAQRYRERGEGREEQDFAGYVSKDRKDVFDAWKDIKKDPESEAAQYWRGRMGVTEGDDSRLTRKAFGQALIGESQDIAKGRYKGDLGPGIQAMKDKGIYKEGGDVTTGGYMQRVAGRKEGDVVIPPPDDGGEDNGDEDNNWSNPQGTVYDSSTTKMDMATLTDGMDLSNKLTEIINTNSPLFKAATTRAMQAMAKRGIVNSSIAQGEVMNAILAVAMPIAQAEVKALTDNMYYNTDWTNKDKSMANEYAYNNMLKKLQGAIDYQLKLLTESGLYQRQRMGDMASLMGKGYGEENMPQASIWGQYSNMFKA